MQFNAKKIDISASIAEEHESIQGHTCQALGGSWTVKLCGNDTQGAFSLLDHTSDPGVEIPLHKHAEEDEALFVLEGAVNIYLTDGTRRLEPGSTIYLPRGVVHGAKVVGNQPCRMLHVITPAGLEHYFQEVSRLSDEQHADWTAIVDLSAEYGIQFLPP